MMSEGNVMENPAIPLFKNKENYPCYSGEMPHEIHHANRLPDNNSYDNKITIVESTNKRHTKYDHVGHRLAKRKLLMRRRQISCEVALFFALLGIILMIVETEISIANITDNLSKNGPVGNLIKCFITATTVLLLGFVSWYHFLETQLFMCDNAVDDWRLAMSSKRLFSILLEMLVCAIHPFYGLQDFRYQPTNPVTKLPGPVISIPVDVLFSIPMFLRLFLFGRVILFRSRIFTDASSQSLGALNKINFNFSFMFKSYMNLHPAYVLLVIVICGLLIASWSLRACDMYYEDEPRTKDFLNALWVIPITFLTVGYGDIVPHSYCGRFVAICTGLFGAGCTALVVAVLARKLELTHTEKYVHNFVNTVQLDKKFKIASANLVKASWYLYKHKKSGSAWKILQNQRKLLKASAAINNIKQEQRRIVENGVSEVDTNRSQAIMVQMIESVGESQDALQQRVQNLTIKMTQVETKIDSLLATFQSTQ